MTNLHASHANAAKIAELYPNRWSLETLFQTVTENFNGEIQTLAYPKALLFSFSMAFITKNVNGITIQIYDSLIAYLIIQLIDIPEQWRDKLIDKIRYIQACMNKEISYIHWMEGIMLC